jgi:hypothetical protein
MIKNLCVYIVLGNSLYSHLQQHAFFFYKIREQEGGTGPDWEGWYPCEKGEYGANTV